MPKKSLEEYSHSSSLNIIRINVHLDPDAMITRKKSCLEIEKGPSRIIRSLQLARLRSARYFPTKDCRCGRGAIGRKINKKALRLSVFQNCSFISTRRIYHVPLLGLREQRIVACAGEHGSDTTWTGSSSRPGTAPDAGFRITD